MAKSEFEELRDIIYKAYHPAENGQKFSAEAATQIQALGYHKKETLMNIIAFQCISMVSLASVL